MNTVLSIYNYKRLPELVELAHTLKVNYMFVEPLIVYSELGRKMKLQEKHLKEFKFYLKEAIRRANQYGIYSNFTTLETNLAPELIKKSSSMHEVIKKDAKKYDPDSFLSVPCYDPFFHMTIKADGRVISCDVATDAGENVKLHTLREIWWGHYFQNHREAMLNHQIPKFCRQCNPSHTTQRRWLREMMNSRIKSVKSLNPVV